MDIGDRKRIAHDNGYRFEADYHGCAQCTIAAIQDALDLRNDAVFRAASCLGGGISNSGDGTCGAYCGAAIMIGFLWGRDRDLFNGDRENLQISYDLTQRFRQWFIEKYGNCSCKEVQQFVFGRSFDLLDHEDKDRFEQAGAHRDKCPEVVGEGAARAVQMILEEMQRQGILLEHFLHLADKPCEGK